MTTTVENKEALLNEATIATDSTVSEKLNGLLANGLVFYQKLRHYHWRVQGRHFFGLHEKFEEMYKDWADWNDEIAERLLTVGAEPLATLHDALELATIIEDNSTPTDEKMVANVLTDLKELLTDMKVTIEAAEEVGDRGTVNLIDGISDEVEKTTWMLRAVLA